MDSSMTPRLLFSQETSRLEDSIAFIGVGPDSGSVTIMLLFTVFFECEAHLETWVLAILSE